MFVYCCPDSTPRTTRMLYATTKAHVLDTLLVTGAHRRPFSDMLQAQDIVPDIRSEISEPSDLTAADVDFEARTATVGAPVPPVACQSWQAAEADVRTEQPKRNPAEEQGSLSAFLASTQGRAASKKKIVMPPPGAY